MTNLLPDPSLPVDEQLAEALKTINGQNKVVADLKGHVKVCSFSLFRFSLFNLVAIGCRR